MHDPILTNELKQMNVYWKLLVGLVNESLGIIHTAQLTPEARLHQIHERLIFVQRYTRELPPSVRAELDANPSMQAMLAHMRQPTDDLQDGESAAPLPASEENHFLEAPPDTKTDERSDAADGDETPSQAAERTPPGADKG